MAQNLPPREYRDTEPLAVWGLVLSIVFWPAGLVVSWLALRHIRRTGDPGWGIAVIGVALSTFAAVVTVIAAMVLFARSDIPGAWSAAAQERADARRVSAAVNDELERLVEEHESTGTWPRLSAQDAEDVDIQGFRTGDVVCVEGRLGSQMASRVAGDDLEAGVRCGDLGFEQTLNEAAAAELRAAARQHEADLLAAATERADAVAAQAVMGPDPDAGLLGHEPADLHACSAVRATWAVIDDEEAREGFILYMAAGYEENAEAIWYWSTHASSALPDHPEQDPFTWDLLYREQACWLGGFTSSVWSPPLPSRWTTPLTQEQIDRSEALRLAAIDGDETAKAQIEAENEIESDEIRAALREAWERV